MAITQSKIDELLALAESEGIQLPYAPDMIARLEETGAVVDLNTGVIVVNGENQQYSITTYGEAWNHLNGLGLI